MTRLPDPQQPTAPQAGQPTPDTDPIWNAYDRAILEGRPYAIPTFYRDDTKPPAIGTTPPVPQPGRPPMSQRAVDASTLMLSGSVAYAVVAGSTSVALWATHFADPKVIAVLCAAPPAIAVPILALCTLAKRAKQVVEAAPPTVTNHYSGYVDQRQVNVSSRTTGLIAGTSNRPELPPAH